MAIKINRSLTPLELRPRIGRLFELSASKLLNIERTWKPSQGMDPGIPVRVGPAAI